MKYVWLVIEHYFAVTGKPMEQEIDAIPIAIHVSASVEGSFLVLIVSRPLIL